MNVRPFPFYFFDWNESRLVVGKLIGENNELSF